MNIAVFGGGIAGLMSAIALGRNGHPCKIYERGYQSHDAGMGFILLPEGFASLEAFGIQPEGTPLQRYCCRDSRGTLLHCEDLPPGTFGILRRELVACLLCALPSNNMLIFGYELEGLEFDSSGAVVAARLNSGSKIKADVYVAADGMISRARHALFPNWPAAPAQVQEITGLARSADVVRWAENDFNKFHAVNGGVALGIVPVNSDQVVWYLQFDSARFSPSARTPEALHNFATTMAGDWAEPIPDLLAITEPSQVYLWRPLDTDLIPRFHQRNLVLVGDAAHPLLPFTSQGLPSAIADAILLSKLLGIDDDVEERLSCYSLERQQRCSPYIDQGRKLKERFLLPLTEENILLPIAGEPDRSPEDNSFQHL